MASASELPLSVSEIAKNLYRSHDKRSVIESEEEIAGADHSQMKVIGAALCRTGTKSLREALTILGFKCYHMQDVVSNKQELLWIEAAKAKSSGKSHTINWNTILSDPRSGDKYQATVDNPGCLYYKEMLDFYPNAKVILTQRDFKKWYASAQRTVWQTYLIASLWQARYILGPNTEKFLETNLWYSGGLPRFDGKDMEGAKAFYEKYQEEVKKNVPPDQLLVYSVKEGWEPLCNFLGVDIPKVDFPHANKGGDALQAIEYFVIGCKIMNAGIVFGIACFAFLLLQTLA